MPTHPRIYLDYAATAPLRDEVRHAMLPHLGERFGNPSSLHEEGCDARTALEEARSAILHRLGAPDTRLAFCGGGTEADAAAILGVVFACLEDGLAPADLHLVASAVEHSAVHGALEQAALLGVRHDLVAVDGFGRVDPDDVLAALRPETILVSIMAVNNEVGTIEPVAEIASMLADRGVPLHCDAIQMVGKEPFGDRLPGDLVVASGHKISGPQGIAGLFVRPGVRFRGLVRGGPQEDGMRGGTQAVALAVGFARAVELAVDELDHEPARLRILRDGLWASIESSIDGVRLNTRLACAAPHILGVSFESVEGESLLRDLDHAGVAVSTGSACNVGAAQPSRVLRAMGRSEASVRGSLRFSLGLTTSREGLEHALQVLESGVRRLRSIGPARR